MLFQPIVQNVVWLSNPLSAASISRTIMRKWWHGLLLIWISGNFFSSRCQNVAYASGFCKRTTDKKNESPFYVCSFNATIYRRSECSIFVVEDIVFPHTTGKNENRVVPVNFHQMQFV